MLSRNGAALRRLGMGTVRLSRGNFTPQCPGGRRHSCDVHHAIHVQADQRAHHWKLRITSDKLRANRQRLCAAARYSLHESDAAAYVARSWLGLLRRDRVRRGMFLAGVYMHTNLAAWGFLALLIGLFAMSILLFTGVHRTHPAKKLPRPRSESCRTRNGVR